MKMIGSEQPTTNKTSADTAQSVFSAAALAASPVSTPPFFPVHFFLFYFLGCKATKKDVM